MEFDESRKSTFDQASLDYDRYRPGYPEAAIADMLAFSSIAPDSRVLEIGYGTGKATVSVAKRGIRVDAVELGVNLAAVASNNCTEWPRVSVTASDFESTSLPQGAYDLVFSAQAFHWINPKVRLSMTCKLLRSNGSLALLYIYTRPPTDGVLKALGEAAAKETGGEMKHSDPTVDIERWTDELSTSRLYRDLRVARHPWVQQYGPREYQGLFRTYSDYMSLDPATKERVEEVIQRTIEEYGGSAKREYECVLFHVKKSDGSGEG
jgi:SAM-dependent methyltransferase